MADIGSWLSRGAATLEMPHVIEITLPMLCSYLPRCGGARAQAPHPALPAGAPPPFPQPSPPTTSQLAAGGHPANQQSTTWALMRPLG